MSCVIAATQPLSHGVKSDLCIDSLLGFDCGQFRGKLRTNSCAALGFRAKCSAYTTPTTLDTDAKGFNAYNVYGSTTNTPLLPFFTDKGWEDDSYPRKFIWCQDELTDDCPISILAGTPSCRCGAGVLGGTQNQQFRIQQQLVDARRRSISELQDSNDSDSGSDSGSDSDSDLDDDPYKHKPKPQNMGVCATPQSTTGVPPKCVNGSCSTPSITTAQCSSDADCGCGNVCSSNQECVAGPTSCSNRSGTKPCPLGSYCAGPKGCLDGCLTDSDCKTGYGCWNNACVVSQCSLLQHCSSPESDDLQTNASKTNDSLLWACVRRTCMKQCSNDDSGKSLLPKCSTNHTMDVGNITVETTACHVPANCASQGKRWTCVDRSNNLRVSSEARPAKDGVCIPGCATNNDCTDSKTPLCGRGGVCGTACFPNKTCPGTFVCDEGVCVPDYLSTKQKLQNSITRTLRVVLYCIIAVLAVGIAVFLKHWFTPKRPAAVVK